jgi:preprotein translocase subunit YajC
MTKIKQYDKIRLKSGLVGCVVEIFGAHEYFIVDVELGTDETGFMEFDTIDVYPSDIKSRFVEYEEPVQEAV